MSTLKSEEDYRRVLAWVQKRQPDVEEPEHIGIAEESRGDWVISARDGRDLGFVVDRVLRDADERTIAGPFEGHRWHERLARAIVKLLRERGGFTAPEPSGGGS